MLYDEGAQELLILGATLQEGARGRPFYVLEPAMIYRVGIFVDAGYLFAQGSTCLAGSKADRTACHLDPQAAVAALLTAAAYSAPDAGLLRIYWYDAVGRHGPTTTHDAIAARANVKLRLGFLNNQGQQKGVDSLIVTDMIELARNQAMSDAVIVSGDEDVRVGVQVAQVYGVRVHLVGIHPARGSQSRALLHEADTTIEWDRSVVSTFLSVVTATGLPSPLAKPADYESLLASGTAAMANAADLQAVCSSFLLSLTAAQRQELTEHLRSNQSLPGPFDKVLLAHARTALGRYLDEQEKRDLRAMVRASLGGLPEQQNNNL